MKKKPESSIKVLSDLERYEIFNLESAEKYDSASNIDFIIDEEEILSSWLLVLVQVSLVFLVVRNMLKYHGNV